MVRKQIRTAPASGSQRLFIGHPVFAGKPAFLAVRYSRGVQHFLVVRYFRAVQHSWGVRYLGGSCFSRVGPRLRGGSYLLRVAPYLRGESYLRVVPLRCEAARRMALFAQRSQVATCCPYAGSLADAWRAGRGSLLSRASAEQIDRRSAPRPPVRRPQHSQDISKAAQRALPRPRG